MNIYSDLRLGLCSAAFIHSCASGMILTWKNKMTLQKIEFEYDIPDGYRFVRYGKPKRGDQYLRRNDDIQTWLPDFSADLDAIIIEFIMPEHESKKHRWHDFMIEFANDKTLRFEFKDPSKTSWHDAPQDPAFREDLEYRKKPTKKTVRFRNYLNKANKVKAWDKDHTPDLFVKWIGDWQEIEI